MKLDPAERLLLLSQLVDELPDDAGGELVRVFASACFAVVRHMRGAATETETRFAIEWAREALRSGYERTIRMIRCHP